MTQRQQERVIKIMVLVESKAHSAAELAGMLGLAPDESWEIGTPFQLGSRQKPRDTSSWAVVERAVRDEDCGVAAERLVARLQGFVPQFQALPAEVNVWLTILVDETTGVFGLGLDTHHVKFAAAIGAYLNISIAVYMSIEDLERDLVAAKRMQ